MDIDRKNHILLDRIAFQMVNPSEVSDLHTAQRISVIENQFGGHFKATGTLHGPKRKQDMKKIQSENLVSGRMHFRSFRIESIIMLLAAKNRLFFKE